MRLPTARRRPWWHFLFLGLAVIVLGSAVALAVWPRPRPVLLRGTLLTPAGPLADGWLLIQNQMITSVTADKPTVADAIEIDTGGIILPGLIDLHNHISYDVLPAWAPPQVYADRYQWQNDPLYVELISQPYDHLVQGLRLFCDMNTYGELRALAGGTTSILATADPGCISGLVRNLDYASGFYGLLETDRQHVRTEIELRAGTGSDTLRAAQSFLASASAEALVVHLAEGTDAASLEEFSFLQQNGLLTSKTLIVHGVALGLPEFQAMHTAGAALIWSPRSNLTLYGATADILAAQAAGVPVALAPDWAVTGSPNLLAELQVAAQWNADHLNGALTDEQLVAMTTSTPAHLAGIGEKVGRLAPGLFADILVIAGDRADPYQAVVTAEPEEVQLVFIGGQPLYGDAALMANFWPAADLDALTVGGQAKAVKLPAGRPHLPALEATLQSALSDNDIVLAPLP